MSLRCETCGGTKSILGFGGLKKPCPNCVCEYVPVSDVKIEDDVLVSSKIDRRSKEYREMNKQKEA